MKYNLYYNNMLINDIPIDSNNVKEILSHKQIGVKPNPYTNKLIKINTNKIKVVKCIILD